MREILFRGIWVHGNKEWIEGDLVRDSEGKPHIVDTKYAVYWGGESTFVCEDECEVIPETVGQYTGLTDKNGKRIFEGDIVKYEYKGFRCEKCAIYLDVQYCEMCGVYKPFGDSDDTFASDKVEVIGNVFDNPELLEVK